MDDPTPARVVALAVARRRLLADVDPWETVWSALAADAVAPADVQAELRKIADELKELGRG